MMSYSEKPASPSITVRPSREVKASFSALAATWGLSESAAALRAIHMVLQSFDASTTETAAASIREPATDRLTIRLRPGDGDAIAQRASERRMKASTYVAALVRGHLSAHPPLPGPELSALKQSVATLADVSRMLRRLTANPSINSTWDALALTRRAVKELEHHTQDFVTAALISWECRCE
jgi:hypothetical protein